MSGDARTPHQDPRDPNYVAHQEQQRSWRRAAAKGMILQNRSDLSDGTPNHEKLGLEFVVDRNGRDLSWAEHNDLRQFMATDRAQYRAAYSAKDRKGGLRTGVRWMPLRQFETHLIAKDGHFIKKIERGEKIRKNEKKKADPIGSRRVRVELAKSDVITLKYEAFTLAPWHSRGVLLAAEKQNVLTLEFLKILASDLVPVVEKFTKCEVVAVPHHPKTWACHFQPSFVCVDSSGNKMGDFDWCHFGRALVGAWRLWKFGYKGKALDEMTGKIGSTKGLAKFMRERGRRSVDLKVARWMDGNVDARLREPRFEPLREFFDKARKLYSELKNSEIQAIQYQVDISELYEIAVDENSDLKNEKTELISSNSELSGKYKEAVESLILKERESKNSQAQLKEAQAQLLSTTQKLEEEKKAIKAELDTLKRESKNLNSSIDYEIATEALKRIVHGVSRPTDGVWLSDTIQVKAMRESKAEGAEGSGAREFLHWLQKVKALDILPEKKKISKRRQY